MRNACRAVIATLLVAFGVVAPTRDLPVAEAATLDLLVGDSVMAGMSSASRAPLPNHVFDAKVCRRLITTSCTYRGVRPSTALQVVQSMRGAPVRAIVVGAGYNDGSVGSAVDAVVAEARRQGVRHVLWLTYRIAGSNAATYRSHNAVLWQKASQYPELRIVDWAGYSAARPDWVAADGLHLNGSGAVAMANLVAAALSALPPPPPPLTPGEILCFGADGLGRLVAPAAADVTPVGARGLVGGSPTTRPLVAQSSVAAQVVGGGGATERARRVCLAGP